MEGIRLGRWLRLVIAPSLMSLRCLKGLGDGQSHATHSVSGSIELYSARFKMMPCGDLGFE